MPSSVPPTLMQMFSSSTPCQLSSTPLLNPVNECSRSLTQSNSRPHTPPTSSKSSVRHTQSPPARFNSAITSSPKRSIHSQAVLKTQSEWGVGIEDDDEDEEEDEQYFYCENVDEDEFGLPSISSMRRQAKSRIPTNRIIDSGGGRVSVENGLPPGIPPNQFSGRGIADSSDIAEEREPLNYPSAKKSEGKILRPQYKDILRGS